MSHISDLPVMVPPDPMYAILYKKPGQLSMVMGGAGGQLTWRVPDSIIAQFLKVVGGLPEVIAVAGNPPSTITRIVSLRHPLFPNLLASDVQATGVGFAANGNPTMGNWWKYWDVQVTFSTPQYQVDGSDPFLNIATRPSGRTIAMPASAATFTAGDHPVIDPGVYVPGMTYEITINGLPSFSEAFWFGYFRTINSTTFRNFAPHTVLFNGPALNRTVTIGNVVRNNVTIPFEISALDWNYEAKASGALDTMSVNGSPWYTAVDFNQIFAQ